ncbi:MAG TPA: BamA/TamA family outer membrane protein [Vicinamibacterales bacterium]|nr:BamA/TamA family outer membrane protein [Vicinamibacterales bacterium]
MKRLSVTLARACALCCALVLASLDALAQNPAPASGSRPASNELDVFMQKVLARREVNRKTLEQYILDETESFEILGPGRWPLYRTKRDYTWYVRDGMHVRSPVRFNGVKIAEDARERYETRWIRRERERQERKAKNDKDGKDDKESSDVSITTEGVQVNVGGTPMPTEPRFVSEAYFMDFKFEAGNYYLAGREQLEGHEVLKIEYYPTKMFGDDERRESRSEEQEDGNRKPAPKPDPKDEKRDRQRKQVENEIERRMNKTALITLWVDPAEHQIVKYTFDNVWLDFLPAGWLVKIDDIRASMTMGQPFPGVWLPRELNIHSGITLANGSYEGGYERKFEEYRLAEVATKMRVPKKEDPEPEEPGHGPFVRGGDAERRVAAAPPTERTVAQVAAGADSQQEVIGEIRIHGNAFLSDKEVLDFAGIAVGQLLPADGIEAITKRLKDSDRFESVEVRKRYRSLTDTTDVALVLVVHEKPGVRSAIGGVDVPGVPGAVARPVGRLRSKLMFLPIISYADGYGFTYGGRVSTVDLFGINERLSVPLTWGGTRRAALEFERIFKTGPLTRIESSFGVWNRENPRFEIRDQRVELNGRAERVFADVLRAGVDASRSTISFGILDDDLWTIGTSLGVDTRLDPAFPANALFVTGGWTGMHFRTIPDRVNRLTGDARGYLRGFRQIVVAGRASYTGTDASLPPYERLLLGGSSTLRGFDTGAFAGDRMLSTSAEVRVPLTSVLNGAKLGITVFTDAGKAWDFGSSMDQAEWHRGVGGGLFLIASIVRVNLDIARGLKTGDIKVHLSSGFTF